MRVLVLSDGVAGHDRSSLGIVAALSRRHRVDAQVLPVREARRVSRRLTRLLASFLPFGTFFRSFYRLAPAASPANPLPVLDAIPTERIDVVVSTGPRTAAANIALARRLKARNIYFGHPRWPSTGEAFTLLLTAERGSAHPRRAYALRPSEIDAAQLPAPRALAPNGDARQASLLFGGQSKHYSYTAEDMHQLAGQLVRVTQVLPWLRWTIYDSRRTERAAFDLLVARLARDVAPIRCVRFHEGGLLSNSAAYSSDFVLVTADSMSMIAESIAARRPTAILFADLYQAPRHDAREHASLIADRRAFPITIAALTADAIRAGAVSLQPLTESPLDMLAEILARHGL